MEQRPRKTAKAPGGKGVTISPKRVTYKDQKEKRERKALRRQKHATDAYNTLRRLMETKGSSDSETITALEAYVERCCETATYQLDMQHHEDAARVLDDCTRVLKNEIQASFPKLLYKVHYRQAEIQNAMGLHNESLVYLRQAIAMAEEQEAMDGDPLSCMAAETYLNAAIAFQFVERLSEAVEVAMKATKASQAAVVALAEVQQQPAAFRDMTPEQAQNQLMIQLDVQIQSYLVHGQALEKMNRFEDATVVLQDGRQLLEQHFGAQHPLMSDFAQVEQHVKMQVDPSAIEPDGQRAMGSARGEGLERAQLNVDPDSIAALLDKRSELMKRGRVRRVYYEHTEVVQNGDMRAEFDELEDIHEEKEFARMDVRAQSQSGWMQRQQLMAMRQQQDEQFRMMELVLATQSRSVLTVESSHPKVFLPMQYSYAVGQKAQAQGGVQETQTSSSEPSESTDEEPEPVKEKTPPPTPPPESESSVSSQSDSLDHCEDNMGEMRNYQSEDSESDQEAPPGFLEVAYDPIEVEARRQVRQAGRDPTFKEKNFKSGIYFRKRKAPEPQPIAEPVAVPNVEPIVQPIIKVPEEPKIEELEVNTADLEWARLCLIIKIQARVRRFLRVRRRRQQDHFGEVCPAFFLRHDQLRFRVAIFKVQVAHTIRRQRTRVEHVRVRHRDESEMHQVEDKVQQAAAETTTRQIIMYQILVQCSSEEAALGESQCLITVADFPAEFPYLIDYMRHALALEIVKKKGRLFQVIFTKLTWSVEQEIVQEIRQMLIGLDNKAARALAHQGTMQEVDVSFEEVTSHHTGRIDEIDYDEVREKLRVYENQGHDIEALRRKIQWEARQLITHKEVQSTEIKRIVHRSIRKERDDWKGYISINEKRPPIKTVVTRRPGLATIVKVQALIRGFLARRNTRQPWAWERLFDFVVQREENYYLVRVYKAPENAFERMEFPYQVEVTRHMKASDSYKLRLKELPHAGETCKQDMIDSIEIDLSEDVRHNIACVRFRKLVKSVKVADPEAAKGGKVPEQPDNVEIQEEKEGKHEFIEDWGLPPEHERGVFTVRKFRMYPNLVVTLSYQHHDKDSFGPYYCINVLYWPDGSVVNSSADAIKLRALPTKLSYMVYYLKRHLKVHFKNAGHEIEYAALSPFQHGAVNGKQAFEREMLQLRGKFNLAEEQKRESDSLAKRRQKRAEALRRREETCEVVCNLEIQQHGNMYTVKVLKNVDLGSGGVIPFRLAVFKTADQDDVDYINLHALSQSGDVLKEQLKNYLRVYIDPDSQRIRYVALTKLLHVEPVVADDPSESEERPVEPPRRPIPLRAIIKAQAIARGWLARRRVKREFEGFLTRFNVDGGELGRRARVTVWKTLVERTRRKRKVKHIVEKRDGVVANEEIKQEGDVEVFKEQIMAYQVEVENVYVPQNRHQKVVLTIPPKSILIPALRRALEIKWRGTYGFPIDKWGLPQGQEADWIESINISKRLEGYAAYNRKIGHEDAQWDEATNFAAPDFLYRLMQVHQPESLDSSLVKIVSHPAQSGQGSYDLKKTAGQLVLTVREVFKLLNRSRAGEELADADLDDIAEDLRYQSSANRNQDWDIILQHCCTTQPAVGNVLIDEQTFGIKRFGFNPAQARSDAKAVTAASQIQKAVRKFLSKRHTKRMRRTPGYAMATGVYRGRGFYLVYLLKASNDQQTFTLTLKERNEAGERIPMIAQQRLDEAIIEEATARHQNMFKLQSIQKVFEQWLLTSGAQEISDGRGGAKRDWQRSLVEQINQKFSSEIVAQN